MSFNIQDIKESVRIKENNVTIKVMTFTGKDGDYFVSVSPALLVSGYGATEEEATESFKENIETFCEDLLKLSPEKRNTELSKLGFNQERYHQKNYSKAYVDENGVLQGLEPTTLKTSMLEATV
jgi:predicted RNase H-like HicB family nuclease